MSSPPRNSNPIIPNRPLRIGFIHPDLGLGGAEKLVVDAAVALKRRGHEVVIYTSRHEKARCFEETRDGECILSL